MCRDKYGAYASVYAQSESFVVIEEDLDEKDVIDTIEVGYQNFFGANRPPSTDAESAEDQEDVQACNTRELIL